MTKKEILEYFSDINTAYNNAMSHDNLSGMLDELIGEDRQEIIRCRDCKHAMLTTKGEVKYCQFWQGDEDGSYGGDPLYLGGDFFCAGAERR